ncbi:hypothetical protein ACI0FW_02512 [Alcaligenes nematophilus]
MGRSGSNCIDNKLSNRAAGLFCSYLQSFTLGDVQKYFKAFFWFPASFFNLSENRPSLVCLQSNKLLFNRFTQRSTWLSPYGRTVCDPRNFEVAQVNVHIQGHFLRFFFSPTHNGHPIPFKLPDFTSYTYSSPAVSLSCTSPYPIPFLGHDQGIPIRQVKRFPTVIGVYGCQGQPRKPQRPPGRPGEDVGRSLHP